MKKILILIVAVFLGFGLFKLLEGFANSTSDAPWGPNIDDVSAQFIIQKVGSDYVIQFTKKYGWTKVRYKKGTYYIAQSNQDLEPFVGKRVLLTGQQYWPPEPKQCIQSACHDLHFSHYKPDQGTPLVFIDSIELSK